MEINKKSLSYKDRIKLKILIEDFLDKDWKEILEEVKTGKTDLGYMVEKIGEILLPFRYYGDALSEQNIPDKEDGEYSPSITDDDRIHLLFIIHTNLKTLWNELKNKILKNKTLCLNSGPEKITGYDDIIISKPRILPRSAKNKLNFISIKSNFDDGEIHLIRDDVDLVNNFINFLEDLPLDVFAKCEKCGKFIIITRKDRNCCSTNCAAGLIQKEKWEKLREEREKEQKLMEK